MPHPDADPTRPAVDAWLQSFPPRDAVTAPTATDLLTACTALAQLVAQARALAAPYDAQIRSLEIARTDATAALLYEIDTLKTLIRPLILAQQASLKIDGLSAIYVHKPAWDTPMLVALAEQFPSILECQTDKSFVMFR